MKRADFYSVISPLTEQLFELAHTLVSDKEEAKDLVLDAVSAYLFKEKRAILRSTLNTNSKMLQLQRKDHFKGIIRHIGQLGFRRATRSVPEDQLQYARFHHLEPKIRFILRLRYIEHFSVDEISDIFNLPRYEVIEKLHNGRFLLNATEVTI